MSGTQDPERPKPDAKPPGDLAADKTLRYIFLAALAGAAGTAVVGFVTSSTTLSWIASLVSRSNLPRGAIVFVSAPDCGSIGDGWQKYDLAEGRFVVGADGGNSRKPGQTKDGRTSFKIAGNNLPPTNVAIPFRFSNTSASNGGFPLMRTLGPTGADSGASFTVTLPFENNEIDVTPPSISLLACQRTAQ
jgi:hypothetical protein